MPNLNIREYDSNAQIQASDRGPESMNIAGRRIGALYSEAASAQQAAGRAIGSGIAEAGEQVAKYQSTQDISHGAVGFAGILAAATQDWNDTASEAAKKNPNDPTVAQKFMQEHLEPALEKFRSGFTTDAGRKWADERINAMRQHFTEKTISDMSQISGHASAVNQKQTEDALSVMASKDGTAKGIQMALDTLSVSAKAVADSSNMSAVDKARFLEERVQHGSEKIVQAGIQSALWKDPSSADALQTQFAKYVNAGELQSQRKQIETMKRQDYVLNRQLQHDEQQKISNENFAKGVDNLFNPNAGPGEKLTHEAISQVSPDQLLAPQRLKLHELVDHIANKQNVINSGPNLTDTLLKVWAGEITTPEQIHAMLGTKLSFEHHNQAIAVLEDKKNPERKAIEHSHAAFMTERLPYIMPKDDLNHPIPQLAERGAALEAYIQQQFKATPLKDQGKLWDPHQPEYIGNSPLARPVSPYERRAMLDANRAAERAPEGEDKESAAKILETRANPYNDPKKKDNYYPDAKFDARKGYWYVLRDGQKLEIQH